MQKPVLIESITFLDMKKEVWKEITLMIQNFKLVRYNSEIAYFNGKVMKSNCTLKKVKS